VKECPDPELYKVRFEMLELLEEQAQKGNIDLFYGDESKVCEQGYVPYGWQFEDEKVSIPSIHGQSLNCFGLLSRQNELIFSTTQQAITTDFVIDKLEILSLKLAKPTVVVLDNAKIHTSRKVKERLIFWENRGLYIFYLPPYSPHLNIIERLWRELKARWLMPEDYLTAQSLFLATYLALAAVGKELFINFNNSNNIN
jgi:transposase